MNIAYTIAPGKGDTDLLLQSVAEQLVDSGYRVCGTVQINTEGCDDGPCDMDVRVLPTGPDIRISQSLGKGSRGCRLDPLALEDAVGLVQASLAEGADIMIINKFGKHEADGRGFRPVIAEAVALDIPVIVGVNSMNLTNLKAFAEDMAHQVSPDRGALVAWGKAAAEARQCPA